MRDSFFLKRKEAENHICVIILHKYQLSLDIMEGISLLQQQSKF